MFLFVIAYLGDRADAPVGRRAVVAAVGALRRGRARSWSRSSSRSGSRRRRRLSDERRDRSARSAARRRSAGSSSPTTCSRSRSRRSCCSSPRSAASCSATRSRAEDEEDAAACTGPTSPGTSSSRRSCSRSARAGVLLRRSPLIVLLSLEIMLNGAQPRPDRVLAPATATIDGQVFALAVMAVAAVRGRRRPRPDRRDRARSSSTLDVDTLTDAARMIASRAWICLLAPLAARSLITLARHARSRAAGAAGSRPLSVVRRLRAAPSSRSSAVLGERPGGPRTHSRPPGRGSRPGSFDVGARASSSTRSR